MIVSMLSHLLVRGYVETLFYSCQTRKTHLSHWGSFGQVLQLSGWIRWSFFVKYLAPNSSCSRSRAVGLERFSYLQRNAFSGQKRKERLPNSFLKPLNFNASHSGDDSEKDIINIGGAILLQRKHTGEGEG